MNYDQHGIDGSTASGDLDDRLSLTSGRALLSEDLRARIEESPGNLYYDAEYGAGLIDLINEAITDDDLPRIESRVVTQCLLDERIQSATAKATWTPATRSLHLAISLEDADGPFDLVLSIDSLTVSILGVS
jgi:hypothetical protein